MAVFRTEGAIFRTTTAKNGTARQVVCVFFLAASQTRKDRAGQMSTPTQRSLKLLRREGYTVAIAERWNPFARRRVDLFGFIDLIAVHDEQGIVGVQTTSAHNLTARISKIRSEPQATAWLRAGGRIEVHGWRRSKPGSRRREWVVERRTITLIELSPTTGGRTSAPTPTEEE
jgi:hypothetical protein